nr:PIG-L family deacetylase [Candidatus Freyarchaeota archaeon]
MSRILVFGAHPDDEVIGMGGTIAKLVREGHEVRIVVFTRGDEGYPKIELKEAISEVRREELENAAKVLGVKSHDMFDIEDMGLINDKETFKRVIKTIREYQPGIIFTHRFEDRHRDHVAANRIVSEAWWQAGQNVSIELGEPWRAKKLFYFEIFSPFTFPSHIVDITDTFEFKKKAMEKFASQLSVLPNVLRALEGLAIFRGSLIGTRYGEAFLESRIVPEKGLEV